jgi:hypothetical protein
MADTDNYPRPNPAARFFVLVLTVAFYTLAIASYFQDPHGFSALTYAYGVVGTIFFLFFLFASDRVCETVCTLTTLGGWSLWS